MSNSADIRELQIEITGCAECPRLRAHCARVAEVKRRAYRDQQYWGRPVPSFGDTQARVLILGLAPGAHGANRTGRMFTGDSSGDLLYRVLHNTGFATQPVSRSADDGLELIDGYITASAHCAPPDNKPSREEVAKCRGFLVRELQLLTNVQVVAALGRLAFDNYLELTGRPKSKYRFAHGAAFDLGPGAPVLLASYHPSQQNTSTGKLTESMLEDVFRAARKLLVDTRGAHEASISFHASSS